MGLENVETFKRWEKEGFVRTISLRKFEKGIGWMKVEVEGDAPVDGVPGEEGGHHEVGFGEGGEALHLGQLVVANITVLIVLFL